MASERGERVGQTIGYRVRLDSKISRETRIEVITEGVFTRMILDDPELTGVAAVLFDEFHERSLDGDLGLALARDAQSGLRSDLRIVVMSATLDAARIAALLTVVKDRSTISWDTRGATIEGGRVDALKSLRPARYTAMTRGERRFSSSRMACSSMPTSGPSASLPIRQRQPASGSKGCSRSPSAVAPTRRSAAASRPPP